MAVIEPSSLIYNSVDYYHQANFESTETAEVAQKLWYCVFKFRPSFMGDVSGTCKQRLGICTYRGRVFPIMDKRALPRRMRETSLTVLYL
jgi:hypothetical protein